MIGALKSFNNFEETRTVLDAILFAPYQPASVVIYLKTVRSVFTGSKLCNVSFFEGSKELIDDVSLSSTIAFEGEDSKEYRWSI